MEVEWEMWRISACQLPSIRETFGRYNELLRCLIRKRPLMLLTEFLRGHF